ncbi:MAG: hypothetical protein HOD63_12555 [Bacteroidetes bacterium]|jgi:hypothetical protein|nr:hypothetical protein [Bacteroidota bacterium]MBT5529174.1 hypothetical protein [Cytophagia bacterium]MBT3421285.1 hypothetical protein [Bacteroidota bacterium]MBT3801408.1 hypothetical protein [Bacteroidota bacterium]MBT3933298.1 hypothetical protein [Bacteroidota bacterium]
MKNQIIRTAILFLVILGYFAFESHAQKTPIIYPGKGLDGVDLGFSSEDEIAARFGDMYWLEDVMVTEYFDKDQKEKQLLINNKMIYRKEGLIFHFLIRPEDSLGKLVAIQAIKPYKAVTPQGIELNVSTMQDVVTAYGEGKWGFSNQNKEVVLTYDGIVFHVKMKKKVKEFDKAEFDTLYLSMVVEKITISNDPKKAFY